MKNILCSEGFLYGYGVFETMKVINNNILDYEEHFYRLEKACKVLDINLNINIQKFYELLIWEVSKIKDPIYGLRFSIIKDGNNSFTFINKKKFFYTPGIYKQGFKLKISEYKKNPFSKLVYYKTLNYMENLSELKIAKTEGYDEIIFFNISDHLCECSTSNIFYIKNNIIYTPSIENGLLNGIIRKKIFNWCKNHHYKIIEKNIDKKELLDAEEVFLTNSLMGVMPVYSIENKIFKKIIIKKLIKNFN